MTRTCLLDKVCLVIDLKGFATGHQFFSCDWMGKDVGALHYKPSVLWPDLSTKDRRTATYCTQHVQGLQYYSHGSYHVPSSYPWMSDTEQHKIPCCPLLAFKGRMIKRRWLTSWGIPNINSEPLGGSKFDDLLRLSAVGSCGHYRAPLRHFCPKVECYHFAQWMRDQRGTGSPYLLHQPRADPTIPTSPDACGYQAKPQTLPYRFLFYRLNHFFYFNIHGVVYFFVIFKYFVIYTCSSERPFTSMSKNLERRETSNILGIGAHPASSDGLLPARCNSSHLTVGNKNDIGRNLAK